MEMQLKMQWVQVCLYFCCQSIPWNADRDNDHSVMWSKVITWSDYMIWKLNIVFLKTRPILFVQTSYICATAYTYSIPVKLLLCKIKKGRGWN